MVNRIVPITPPRVAFIDPRTGAVSREWYQFFLSLTGIWDTVNLIVSAPSQEVVASALAELQKQVNAIVIPPATAGVDNGPYLESVASALAEIQKQVEGLLATPYGADTVSPEAAPVQETVIPQEAAPVQEIAAPQDAAPLTALTEQLGEIQKQIDALVMQPAAPAIMDLLAELQKQVNAIPTGGGGGGATIGSATIDLGATPVADASIVVPVVGMLATHSVQVYVMGSDSTVDNDTLAHRHAGMSWQMIAAPAAGSFTLDIACMMDVCWGTFKIRYSYQ
jgi:hypothetical protein